MGVNLCDLELGSGFLDITPNTPMTRKNNWTISKLKTLMTTHRIGVNKGLESRIYKELLNSIIKRQPN